VYENKGPEIWILGVLEMFIKTNDLWARLEMLMKTKGKEETGTRCAVSGARCQAGGFRGLGNLGLHLPRRGLAVDAVNLLRDLSRLTSDLCS